MSKDDKYDIGETYRIAEGLIEKKKVENVLNNWDEGFQFYPSERLTIQIVIDDIKERLGLEDE